MIRLFHGGIESQVINMASNININLGSGELGKGFYTGLSYGLSKTWAYHKTKKFNIKNHSSEDYAILSIEFYSGSFTGSIVYLNRFETISKLFQLRQKNLTKTFHFNKDAVCGQIVGNKKYRSLKNGYLQVKFETNYSELFLNHQTSIEVIK